MLAPFGELAYQQVRPRWPAGFASRAAQPRIGGHEASWGTGSRIFAGSMQEPGSSRCCSPFGMSWPKEEAFVLTVQRSPLASRDLGNGHGGMGGRRLHDNKASRSLFFRYSLYPRFDGFSCPASDDQMHTQKGHAGWSLAAAAGASVRGAGETAEDSAAKVGSVKLCTVQLRQAASSGIE